MQGWIRDFLQGSGFSVFLYEKNRMMMFYGSIIFVMLDFLMFRRALVSLYGDAFRRCVKKSIMCRDVSRIFHRGVIFDLLNLKDSLNTKSITTLLIFFLTDLVTIFLFPNISIKNKNKIDFFSK